MVDATQEKIMPKLVKQPLFWAWFFVVLWAGHSIYAAIGGQWVLLVISLTGLVAALLVVSAIQSRRRKNFYPARHFRDDTLSDTRI
jgi:hypothetical protein